MGYDDSSNRNCRMCGALVQNPLPPLKKKKIEVRDVTQW